MTNNATLRNDFRRGCNSSFPSMIEGRAYNISFTTDIIPGVFQASLHLAFRLWENFVNACLLINTKAETAFAISENN